MINLLVSAPATGKTRTCLDLIKANAKESPLSEKWVIVPDQTQADAIRSRLSSTGTVLSVRVATFTDLCRYILDISADLYPLADKFMLRRFLQETLSDLQQAGQIPYYAPIYNFPGFGHEILERIAELKRSFVSAERLNEIAHHENDPGLIDLAMIYHGYQARLDRHGWTDTEGYHERSIEALNNHADLLTDISLLIVDGFDHFDPVQMQLLQIVAARAADTWITLPGTPDTHRTAHQKFCKTLQALKDILTPVHIQSLTGSPYLSPALLTLEKNVFEFSAESFEADNDIQCIEASSQIEETREALRWLKALILREKVEISQCAIAVPDTNSYRGWVEEAAYEFGLPVRFTQGVCFSATPVYAAMMDLLSLVVEDYPFRLLLDTIRSPFFDFEVVGLNHADAKLLEITGRYGQIVEGLAQWQETLQELSALEAVTEEDRDAMDEETFIPVLPEGETAKRLKEGLSRLSILLSPSRAEMSSRNWAIWLRNLLETTGFFDRLLAAGETQICTAMDSLLVTFAHSDIATGSRSIRYGEFLSAWKELLAASSVMDDDTSSDTCAVRVFSMLEARSIRADALVIMGLSETIFPAVTRTDPFLSEDMRSKLGMESYLDRDQLNLFYQVLTRANRYLLLIRPYLSGDGEPWEPSTYWNAVQELLLNTPLRRHPDEARPLAEAASVDELLFWAARRRAQTGLELPEDMKDIVNFRWRHIAETQTILSNRVQAAADSIYNGDLTGIAQTLTERFGENYRWSASRFESYAGCPFSFLASSLLGLEVLEAPEAGYMANQLGSILHEVLERVYVDAPDPMDTNAMLCRLPEIAGQVFASAPEKYQFRVSPLWEVQKDELLLVLAAAIQGIAEIQPEQGWVPLAFEEKFGLGGRPALQLDTPVGKIRMHGVVDRIDVNGEGQIRVIDYKSGGSNLSARDLNDGKRLQLPIYALAARDALSLGEPVEGFYWKLFQKESSALKLSTYKNENGAGPEEAFSTVTAHLAAILAKIRSGYFSPEPPQRGCPTYCAAASWCWRYQEVKF